MVRPARPVKEMTRRVSVPKQTKDENENMTPRPPIKSRASMPLSATMPRVLNIQSNNIPTTPAPPAPKVSVGGTILIPSSDLAAPSSSPGPGSGAEGLGKYRFTGKVDTRQMSSPRW